ncbi:MAG: hypothetical protein ACRCYU_16200 [Nocardioides sp.]
MALIVVASASGSPGVTTAALGLTLNWPRHVLLVDADPTGASAVFAGFFRGARERGGGLINLAVAQRDDSLDAALVRETLILDPSAPAESSAWFLPGILGHEQAPSLVGLWEPLTARLQAMERSGQDVIVDAGRLGLAGWPQPLVAAADVMLLVTRNSLPALAGARSWAQSLRAQFDEVGGLGRLGLLMVDESGRWPARRSVVPRVRPYTARQMAKALRIPVVDSIGWHPEVAEVYSHGAREPRKFDAAATRIYGAAAASVEGLLAANRAALAPTGSGGGGGR